MAKMVGVWIWVPSRKPSDPVNLTVGGTVILNQQEVNQIGDQVLPLHIRIMDDDPWGKDDEADDFSVRFPGPFNVGPNSFEQQVTVSREDVADTEPGWQSVAELYARVQVSPATTGSIKTNWANSQREDVRFD